MESEPDRNAAICMSGMSTTSLTLPSPDSVLSIRAQGNEWPAALVKFIAKRPTDDQHEEIVKIIAHWFWEQRGRPESSSDGRMADFLQAQTTLYRLRQSVPMLLSCHYRADAVADRLERYCPLNGTTDWGVLVVMDGSPEFLGHAFLSKRRGELEHAPEVVVEAHTGQFCRLVHEAMAGANAKLSDVANEADSPQREFLDTCVSKFDSDVAIHAAISAAIEVRRSLAEFNQSRSLHWNEQFHARISIAQSWEYAITSLSLARRNDVILAPSGWKLLSDEVKLTILSSGFRFGPQVASDHFNQESKLVP